MTNGPTPSGGANPTNSRATLGLTGLTINAMALIAPGAFLWLTLQEQSLYGAPTAGMSMWFGIAFALVLCFATALSYAELSKLYPGLKLLLSLRGASLPRENEGLQICALRQVLHRLEQPFVLLGLSGIDGGCDRHYGWVDVRPADAEYFQAALTTARCSCGSSVSCFPSELAISPIAA